MIRAGIVGCGFIANVHSWGLWAVRKAGHADVRVTAVCDEQTEKAVALAQPHRAEVLGFGELLDSVDVVYVCTPTATHLALVEAAADRGLAIFCEKPLAPDLATAERVAAALDRVPHQVGLVLRSAPVFAALKDAIDSGRYGAPMVASLRDDQFFPIQGQYASTWRADRAMAGGGTLIEHSIHDIDLFRMLLGDPTSVSCRTANRFGYEGIEDLAVASFGFSGGYPDGGVASLVSVWHQVMSRPSTRRLEVFCEEAMLWTEDDNTGPLWVQTSSSTEVIESDPPPWVDELPVPEEVRRPLGLYAEASRRFLACVSAGSAGSPGWEEALEAHRLVDAAYASASTDGAPVVR